MGLLASQWKAIESIAAKLSINHETLRQWVKITPRPMAECDPGWPQTSRLGSKSWKKENAELRRANEILKAAWAFFTRELDHKRPPK